jgi:vacuolar-type H+-ATPase subunit H
MSDEPKNNLALDALQKIKEAEAEARKIIQDAREKTSVKIIRDANKEAEQNKKRVLDEARKQVQKVKKAIIQDAEIEVKRINKETQKEIDDLRERSEETKTEAITKVAANIRNYIEGDNL